MVNYFPESYGDNKEFGVNGIKDVTIYFFRQGYTSANDTETEKYFDNGSTISIFSLRSDQTCFIVSYDNITLTDPTTVILNKEHKEDFGTKMVGRMVIRTTDTETTNIKMRWR